MHYIKKYGVWLCTLLIGLSWPFIGWADNDIQCTKGGKKVCRIVSTSLPLRALPRPFSKLYSNPRTSSKVISSNFKAFWPVYVFQRKKLDFSNPASPKGWYKIGTMVNDPWGWMEAKDILEWRQALVVSYTHPGMGDERRNSVLMFKTADALGDLVESDDRDEQANDIYEGLNASPINVPDELVSREPARFVNIEEKFYMLPVIDFEEVDLFLDETRYLQIAAAVPGSRADEANPDTVASEVFMEQATQMETVEGTKASTLGFDIKFVMDMTGSMGPYIKGTKDAIAKVATMVSGKNIDAQMRYGLVGYRDDVKKVPKMAFVVKNFTEQLVDDKTFQRVIATAKPAKFGSIDYQEEVFAGVKEALTSPWNENTIKFIVLVGDASSHPVGHPQNTSGLNAEEIRELANANKVSVISIHLKAAVGVPDHALAQTQFTQLATNPGSDTPAYIDVSADNRDDFEQAVKQVAKTLSVMVSQVRKGNIQQVKNAPDANTIAKTQDVGDKAGKIAQAVAATALVDYLGKEATPPRDVTAWVMDRDILDPEVRALDVRALLKKSDLNDLIQSLETVQKAVKRGIATQMEFFSALQGVVASTSQGQDITFKGAKRLADAGLLPNWIESLPYKSEILEMSDEMFESLTADERSRLEDDIDSKLELYRKINENIDLWVALDERDPSDAHVYPLPLTALP
ncbi:vWA domain-containing protein [Candidatus Parabeggiatoa sp. HSG14]|uniref:vWA domain-containing protein n=1 Tax=Candidatus Parabeggiatoa sp. HSG14 TaxID=3055593 RepID=UPI0025A886A6|nr:vWA domain-containing protein [Thiotrichales bacterium HSG14]